MKRYPGIRPFTAEDQHLFNGREQEKRDLFRLIMLHDIIVLFGKSGIGKTSLLHAGVCPELEGRNLHPVFIRLNNTEVTPEKQVFQTLKDNNYIPSNMLEGRTLWEYFKKFWFVDVGEVFSPVIIFDQFEELFTLYPHEKRQEFINQLADVANGRLPSKLRTRLQQDEQNNPNSPVSFDLESPLEIKLIFAIRSDYLYLLDELSEDIPAILRCRFHLKMLDKANAIKAITLPAGLNGNYASPPFTYDQDAIDDIIGELGKGNKDLLSGNRKLDYPEIEAFQLQLLCQYIEQKIIEKRTKPGFKVTSSFFGYEEGINRIIEKFYHRVLENAPGNQQISTEKMLALGLIRKGRRIIMEESVLKEEYKITQSLLDYLHDERLLRKEPRKGSFYYEISHDTLVDPILEKYQLIAIQEEKQKQEIRLKEEQRKKKKALLIASVGLFIAALAIIALIVVIRQNNEINASKIKITRQIVQNQIEAARTLKVEGKYEQAVQKLKETQPYSETLNHSYNDNLFQLISKWNNVKRLIVNGDSLLQSDNYRGALQQYEKAFQISPDARIQQKIKVLRINIEEKIQELIENGSAFENARRYDLARQSYLKALEIHSANEKINQQIRSLIDKLDAPQ